jgi:type IV secretory pathway TrbL component
MADDMSGGSVLVLFVTEIHIAVSWTRICVCVLIKGMQVPHTLVHFALELYPVLSHICGGGVMSIVTCNEGLLCTSSDILKVLNTKT